MPRPASPTPPATPIPPAPRVRRRSPRRPGARDAARSAWAPRPKRVEYEAAPAEDAELASALDLYTIPDLAALGRALSRIAGELPEPDSLRGGAPPPSLLLPTAQQDGSHVAALGAGVEAGGEAGGEAREDAGGGPHDGAG